MTSEEQTLLEITSQDFEKLDEEVKSIARKFYNCENEGWSFAILDKIVDNFIDYRGKTPPKSDDGLHMLSAANVKNGFLLPERKEKFVTEKTYNEWTTRGKPKRNDVIITTEAPVGEVGIIRTDEKFLTAQRLITLRAGEAIDPYYLKFCLQYDRTQKQLESYAGGTTVRSFNQTDLRNTVIPIPPMSEQKRIGTILDNIERKIEVNNTVINLLEETAQTIYNNRFVNYDLFDEFKESEIGQIPDSFEVVELGNQIWSGRGYSYTSEYLDKENCIENSYPMINLKSVKENGGFRPDGFKYYTEGDMKDRYLIEEGDLIVAITDLTQEGRLIGSPALVPELEADLNIISQDVAKIVPDEIAKEFLYHLFKTNRFQEYSKSVATGTTVLHLSLTSIGEFKFALPPANEIKELCEKVRKVHKEKSNLIQENTRLEELRDTLLPRLMSGEVRVNNGSLDDLATNSES